MDPAAVFAGVISIARAVLRAPLVHLRLIIETPTLWAPVVTAGLLTALAWHVNRTNRLQARWPRIVEAFACVFGLATFVWMFHAGRYPWGDGDWREEWTFFLAWKQAVQGGGMPYYLGTAMQGTERYLANLQTPLMPYVAALSFVSINTFLLSHFSFIYSVGFIGVIGLRRELAMRLLPWTVFVLIFTLNGHIVSHLSAGHLPWVAYFLTPWVLLSMARVARGDRSSRNAATCAAAFAGMILIGGWHVFVWSWLFMMFACVSSPQRTIVAARISVITALLSAVRIAPALLTFGTGSNAFISGYPTLGSVITALVGVPERTALLDAWEIDAYVGYAGFLLLCLGAIPFRDRARRLLNVMLLPTAVLTILSLGRIYGETLFRLPGLVSERVTTRLIVLPILWLTVAGVVRFDAWWRDARTSLATAIAVLLGVWFLVMQLLLRAQSWRPHRGPELEALPTEVLKAMPLETPYFWAFWSGAAISAATVWLVVRVLRRPLPQQ